MYIETIKSNIQLEGLGDDTVRSYTIDGMNTNITANKLIADFEVDSMNAKLTVNDGAAPLN